MRVSSNEFYINGDYQKNNPAWGINDAPYKAGIISRLIKKNNLTIEKLIEVGCGAGGILAQLAITHPEIKSLGGYDISPQAISLARVRSDDKLYFRNQDFVTGSDETCDMLLVIDVVEHVDNYYQFLRDLKSRGRYFIFQVPLDLSCRTLLKPHVLLQQRSAVGHIHYFSEEMVLWFLRDTGYELVDWVYTKPLTDIHPAPSIKTKIKKRLRNLSFLVSKKLSSKLWGGYSLMLLVK